MATMVCAYTLPAYGYNYYAYAYARSILYTLVGFVCHTISKYACTLYIVYNVYESKYATTKCRSLANCDIIYSFWVKRPIYTLICNTCNVLYILYANYCTL